jgi:hypothetical protein
VSSDASSALAGFSVADLARRWRIGTDKIRGFLRRGELIGTNLAVNLAGRPLWRVSPEEVRRFEAFRSSAPAPKPARRRKKTNIIDFYP